MILISFDEVATRKRNLVCFLISNLGFTILKLNQIELSTWFFFKFRPMIYCAGTMQKSEKTSEPRFTAKSRRGNSERGKVKVKLTT